MTQKIKTNTNAKRIGKRTLSFLLAFTILLTGNLLFVQAVSEQIAQAIPQQTRDISVLMDSLDQYMYFSDAEKKLVSDYVRAQAISSRVSSDNATTAPLAPQPVNSTQTVFTPIRSEVEEPAVPENLYPRILSESVLREIVSSHNSFARCTEEQVQYLLGYLAVQNEKVDTVLALFEDLEEQGYGVYDSVLILQIHSYGIFTLSEAISVYSSYDSRAARDKDVRAFLDFAMNFDIEDDVEEAKLNHIEYTYGPRNGGTYTSASSFAEAKALFLAGYPVKNVRSAYVIGHALGCDPSVIATKEDVSASSLALTSSDARFLAKYAVNLSSVRNQMESGVIVTPIAPLHPSYAIIAPPAVVAPAPAMTSLEELEQRAAVSAELYSMGDGNTVPLAPAREEVQAPYTMVAGENGGVSLNSGASTYAENLFAIPGANGMDINLTLQYSSARAELKTPYMIAHLEVFPYEDEYGNVVPYYEWVYENVTLNDAFTSSFYKIGIGWTFDLPYYFKGYHYYPIHEHPDSDSTVFNGVEYSPILYIPGEGYLKVVENGDFDENNIWNISSYSVTSVNNVVTMQPYDPTDNEDQTIVSVATVSTGRKYYFNHNGHIVKETDRYGNQIIYQYNGNSLVSISNSGGSLNFSYSLENNVRTTTITADMVGSINTTEETEVILTSNKLNGYDNKYSLTSIVKRRALSPSGSNTTSFDYVSESVDFNFWAKVLDEVNNNDNPEDDIAAGYASYRVLLLKNVYGNTENKTTSGSTVSHIRYLYPETSGGINVHFLWGSFAVQSCIQRIGDQTVNRYTYQYTWSENDKIASTATVKKDDDTGVVYTFDEDGTVVKKNSFVFGEYAVSRAPYLPWKEESYTYFGSKPLTRTTTIRYDYATPIITPQEVFHEGYELGCDCGEINGPDGCGHPSEWIDGWTEFVGYDYTFNAVSTTTESWTYDEETRHLTSYKSPKTASESDTEHTTTYIYDAVDDDDDDEEYGLLLQSEYKVNASTTVRLVNTLTDDKKAIRQSSLYLNPVSATEHGIELSRVRYTYDTDDDIPDNNHGNLIKKETALILGDTTSYQIETYTYDSNGINLLSKTISDLVDADGNALANITESYEYDSMGRVTKIIDGRGNATETSYDYLSRILSVSSGPMDDSGKRETETTYAYDDVQNITTVTNPLGGITVYDYDPIGRLVSVKQKSTTSDAGTVVKSYEYDSYGRVTKEYNAQGLDTSQRVEYTYNAWGEQSSKKVYDSNNTLMYAEQGSWNTTEPNAYTLTVEGGSAAESYTKITKSNPYGEVIEEQSFYGASTTPAKFTYTYDYAGNRIGEYYTQYNADGSTSTVRIAEYTYDGRGNVTSNKNTFGDIATITYDAAGRKISESDYKGNVVLYTYDTAGRLIKQQNPIGNYSTAYSTTKHYYDNANNLIKQMQQKSGNAWNTVEHTYDSQNRLTDTKTVVNATTNDYVHYTYDAMGNATYVYSGMGNPWPSAMTENAFALNQYDYNVWGQNTSSTNALNQTESFAYDANGFVTLSVDKGGRATAYTYDAMGREIEAKYYSTDEPSADSYLFSTVSSYDRFGRVLTVSENGYTITNTYSGGNLATQSENGAVKTYTYDPYGNKTSFTLTMNGVLQQSVAYGYDQGFRMTSVSEGGYATNYYYDKNGNRVSMDYTETNSATYYSYNQANQVIALQNWCFTDMETTFPDMEEYYAYDLCGNMTTKTTSGETDYPALSYSYDGAGRLIREEEWDGAGHPYVASYSYDHAGNRVAMSVFEATEFDFEMLEYAYDQTNTTYVYNKANQLTSETTNGVVSSYVYDAHGNLTSKTTGSDVESYTYDRKNRQIAYDDGDNYYSYNYRPDGLRANKTDNLAPCTTHFVWDGMNMVCERVVGDVWEECKNYVYGIGLIKATIGGSEYYYFFNAHGDVTGLVNASSELCAGYSYDAFGNAKGAGGSVSNPFRYCGEYYDTETGTYYLRMRYYDPSIGRFLSEDPICDGLNWYSYCASNPVMYVDPWGLEIYLVGNRISERAANPKDRYDFDYDTQVLLLNQLQELTDHHLEFDPETGYVFYTDSDDEIEFPLGNELIDRHINSDMTLYLASWSETTYVNLIANEYEDYQTNTIGEVNIDLSETNVIDSQAFDFSLGVMNTTKIKPLYISLAHELIHADRFYRGAEASYYNYDMTNLYIAGFVKCGNWCIKPILKTYTAKYRELYTVGVPSVARHIRPHDITENMIRLEHGLNVRVWY